MNAVTTNSRRISPIMVEAIVDHAETVARENNYPAHIIEAYVSGVSSRGTLDDNMGYNPHYEGSFIWEFYEAGYHLRNMPEYRA